MFNQPGTTSATLNRVTGTQGSAIAGQVSANGSVYLINPNGIAITTTGSVRTGGGFVASTLDIPDADFNAGRLNFNGTGASVKGRQQGGRSPPKLAAMSRCTADRCRTPERSWFRSAGSSWERR